MAAAEATRSGPRPWFDAPHRPCFGAAAVLWLVAGAAWAAALAGGLPTAQRALAGAVHALVFGLGPMPLFIAGFLLTAGSRWLKAPAVRGRVPALGAGLTLAGWLVAIAGVALAPAAGTAGILVAGLLLAGIGSVLLLARLWGLRRRATAPSLHFDLALAACSLQPAALGLAAAVAAFDAPDRLRTVAVVGLWWIVLPVFVVAVHRMLPFFESDPPDRLTRRWPQATLGLALAAAAVQGAAAAVAALSATVVPATRPGWAGPVALQVSLAAVALPSLGAILAAALALLSVQRAWHWGRHRVRRAPMLAMLHRAWLWWTLAWVGLALAQWPALDPAWRARLDDAALHALTIGFLGGTMLAMVTRVSATQAGRAAPFDRGARALEALLQGVVLARVGAALLPVPPALLALAALGWAAVAGAWLARHAADLVHGPPATRRRERPSRPAP